MLTNISMSKAPEFQKTICFKNVCFTYPGCRDEVLHDLSFEMKKGHVVALVGSSGSGKTTILDLLPRFYDISSGAIEIDGIDTKTIDLVGLRKLFGIVSQETILFDNLMQV